MGKDKYKLLEDLMEHTPDVIYFKDKKGRLIMVNHAHAKGLGLRPEDVVGKTDFDIHPRERAARMVADDEYVMATGKAIVDKIERATRSDGIDNYVSTTKIPRYDARGKIVGLIGITRDITHRMQYERLRREKRVIEEKMHALEELNSMKSEFVSVVSHELRTPLAIVKEAVSLIFDEIAGPIHDKQKELLKKANDNLDRLRRIIGDLLDLTRIESGTLKLHYSRVDINNLIKESSDFFKKRAKEKQINLNYALPEKRLNLTVDAEKINQVVSNLIDNAIKFTEQDGQIKVEVKPFRKKVRVGVIDTGIGIAKKDLSRLFDKFVQVSPRGSGGVRKGIGLGLAIAKELVEAHGGQMWVESKLGVGSKFYFTLTASS